MLLVVAVRRGSGFLPISPDKAERDFAALLGWHADGAQNTRDDERRVLRLQSALRSRLHGPNGDADSELEGYFRRNIVKAATRRRPADVLIEPPTRNARDTWHCGGGAGNERTQAGSCSA